MRTERGASAGLVGPVRPDGWSLGFRAPYPWEAATGAALLLVMTSPAGKRIRLSLSPRGTRAESVRRN